MIDPAYDPLETIRWMLAEARRELEAETAADAGGRARRKSKARRELDRARFDVLCEVLWNVSGRSEPLEAVAERALAGD